MRAPERGGAVSDNRSRLLSVRQQQKVRPAPPRRAVTRPHDMDLLRAVSWGDAPRVPDGVVHMELWRLLNDGLVRRTPSGLDVTSRGHAVLDEDDF